MRTVSIPAQFIAGLSFAIGCSSIQKNYLRKAGLAEDDFIAF
jgi:hypothetical protein